MLTRVYLHELLGNSTISHFDKLNNVNKFRLIQIQMEFTYTRDEASEGLHNFSYPR